MSTIKIVCDSTCDLSQEIIQERNIETFPLKVCFGEDMYLDQVNLTADQMYKKVEETGALPKTAAATIEEFVELFTRLVGEDGNDVICTGIGSQLSSTFQNAMIAINELNDELASHVYLVDSGNLSTGIGLLVLKMCDMRDKGLTAKEIQEEAERIVPCVRAQFSVKDLTYLHKGGRCSGTAKLFGTLLSIRPILRVFGGKIIASEKIIARRYEKALNFQIEDLKNNIDNVDFEYLFVTHSEADAEADYILENIPAEIKAKFKHIYRTKAGCVVSAHCGQGTIGILYIKKEPLKDDK